MGLLQPTLPVRTIAIRHGRGIAETLFRDIPDTLAITAPARAVGKANKPAAAVAHPRAFPMAAIAANPQGQRDKDEIGHAGIGKGIG
jgi:hypothetical protein